MSYDERDMMWNVVTNCLNGFSCHSVAIAFLKREINSGMLNEEIEKSYKEKIDILSGKTKPNATEEEEC